MTANYSPRRRKIFDRSPSFEQFNMSIFSNSSNKENTGKSPIKRALETKGKYLEVINFDKKLNKTSLPNLFIKQENFCESKYEEYSFITPFSPSFKQSSNGAGTLRQMINSSRTEDKREKTFQMTFSVKEIDAEYMIEEEN